jgi:hypothetical protein
LPFISIRARTLHSPPLPRNLIGVPASLFVPGRLPITFGRQWSTSLALGIAKHTFAFRKIERPPPGGRFEIPAGPESYFHVDAPRAMETFHDNAHWSRRVVADSFLKLSRAFIRNDFN